MFMLGMLKTVLKTVLKYKKNHHHSLRCVLKLSGRGPKIRWQTTRLESEFTRVTEVRHIFTLYAFTEQHIKHLFQKIYKF